jgi:hypothetical protein
MKKELLGLFLYKYDYYEWEHLQCVSFDRERLVQRYEDNVANRHWTPPLLDWSEHEVAAYREEVHYCICPVELLEEDQSVYRGDGLL